MGRRKSNFWSGFGVGAAVGGVAVLLPQLLGRSEADRVVRIEKSIQIGRPVDEVFEAWVDWDRLPRVSEHICDISNRGDRSHWRVEIEGQFVEWDAVTTQHIDGQAIGWKSVNGPKHTGRVNFSPIGEDTIVHVTMNYAPPSRFLNPFKTPIGSVMEALVEKVLREFKGSVESRPRGVQGAVRSSSDKFGPGTAQTGLPRTGTFGDEPSTIESRFGGGSTPLDYNRPPDAKS